MKSRFGAGHALKSPAHITLQMPFRRDEKLEETMIESLENFARNESSFTITLNGFDCFTPRVLFVKITEHSPVVELYERFKEVLQSELGLHKKNTLEFHPHMTIATRDLSAQAFEKAWPEFQKREFEASFEVKSLFLLKHNGKFWDIYREIPFGS